MASEGALDPLGSPRTTTHLTYTTRNQRGGRGTGHGAHLGPDRPRGVGPSMRSKGQPKTHTPGHPWRGPQSAQASATMP